jgi:hypothetical protein
MAQVPKQSEGSRDRRGRVQDYCSLRNEAQEGSYSGNSIAAAPGTDTCMYAWTGRTSYYSKYSTTNDQYGILGTKVRNEVIVRSAVETATGSLARNVGRLAWAERKLVRRYGDNLHSAFYILHSDFQFQFQFQFQKLNCSTTSLHSSICPRSAFTRPLWIERRPRRNRSSSFHSCRLSVTRFRIRPDPRIAHLLLPCQSSEPSALNPDSLAIETTSNPLRHLTYNLEETHTRCVHLLAASASLGHQ